jgi:hypothetical protein
MDILRFLPKNEYDAAISASAPTAANPFATISDISGFVPIAGNAGNPMTGNLVMGNGTTISANNGRGAINLRNFGVDGEVNIDCDGFGVVAGEFGVTPVGVITSGSAGSTFSFINSTFTKIGQISVVNNEGQDVTSGSSPGYPTILSSQNSTIKDGVINSNILGGLGVIAKTDNTAYSNQFGFNTGLAGEMILAHTPNAGNFTATLKAESGTIAYLTDVASIYAINGILTGPRIVTQSGNSLTFTGGSFSTDAYSINGVKYFHNNGVVNNVFAGSLCGENVTGLGNVAMGRAALWVHTTGPSNTAIGNVALSSLVLGSNNTAIGSGSMNDLDGTASNNFNSALGSNTLPTLATGQHNVSVGSSSGGNVFGGIGNTFLGAATGFETPGSTFNHSIAIGRQAKATASNQWVVGATPGGAYVNEAYFGRGVHAAVASLSSFNINATGVSAGIVDGSAATSVFGINGAYSNGTGDGGNVVIRVSVAGAVSNAVQNPLVDLATFNAITQSLDVLGDVEVKSSTKGIILEDRLGGGNRTRVYVQEDAPGLFTLYTESI